jgi:hypothetical protein
MFGGSVRAEYMWAETGVDGELLLGRRVFDGGYV